MKSYPKPIITAADMIQKYQDAGLTIHDRQRAENALNEIGYYRLRGYSFHLYNKATKKFHPNTSFDQILSIYRFDEELRGIVFTMTCEIEVALRVRICNALLSTGDPLAYMDSSLCKDKEIFWKNLSSVSSEIARSSDVFIKHQYDFYDGQVPLWAAVEVMSFGTLSKLLKNLKSDASSPYRAIAGYYSYTTGKGNRIVPNNDMLSSWTHSTVALRNICAHNARIYNRAFSAKPQLLIADQQTPPPKFFGFYQALLAMKYLRPSDESWKSFMANLEALLNQYAGSIEIARLNFPNDWKNHLSV